jgi:hypothetical protein
MRRRWHVPGDRWPALVMVFAIIAAVFAAAPPIVQAAPATPAISDASADLTAGPTGQITINGINFGAAAPIVMIGSYPALVVLSGSSSSVVAALPAGIPPGSYLLSLTVAGNGGKTDEFWVTLGAQGPQGPPGANGAGLDTGVISGNVTACGSPVGHALVYIPGRSFIAYTSASGDFRLDYVPAGAYSVVIEAPNSAPLTVSANVVALGVTSVGSQNVTDTTSDPNNCGACGNVCSSANGTATCTSGSCGIGTCSVGFANCDSDPSDGCEININSDPINCGACGNVCVSANGTATCTNGSCGIGTCSAGFANCDNNATNGCEININSDPNNCGACGNVCSSANGAATCTNGSCGIGTCTAGFANCDNNATNGCETNTNTNINNCGGCGIACNVANGVPACTNGSCGVSACNAGFANCDGNPANGCEININSDPNNCGGCGTFCASGQVCTSGQCVATSCTSDAECPIGDYCNAIAQCVVKQASSSVCTADNQCASGHCTAGICE